jgi:hypothetical protein
VGINRALLHHSPTCREAVGRVSVGNALDLGEAVITCVLMHLAEARSGVSASICEGIELMLGGVLSLVQRRNWEIVTRWQNECVHRHLSGRFRHVGWKVVVGQEDQFGNRRVRLASAPLSFYRRRGSAWEQAQRWAAAADVRQVDQLKSVPLNEPANG